MANNFAGTFGLPSEVGSGLGQTPPDLANQLNLGQLLPEKQVTQSTTNFLESGPRRTRFEFREEEEYAAEVAPRLSHSKQERERRGAELSRSIEKRNRSQNRIKQILLAKKAFQDKFDKLRDKVRQSRKNRDLQLAKLALVIMQAYTEKKRAARKEELRLQKLEEFATNQLNKFKRKRIMRVLIQNLAQHHSWLKQVRDHFNKQKMKAIFRDLYLNAVLNKFKLRQLQRQKVGMLKNLRAIRDYGRQKSYNLNELYKQFMKLKNHLCMREIWKVLARRRLCQTFVQIQQAKRRLQLKTEAMGHWKYYTSKIKEYKEDEITKRFADYDNAIICRDRPGEPLVVMESNDELKYFDVNAKMLNVCQGAGHYKEKDMQWNEYGQLLGLQRATRVGLDKYQPFYEERGPEQEEGDLPNVENGRIGIGSAGAKESGRKPPSPMAAKAPRTPKAGEAKKA